MHPKIVPIQAKSALHKVKGRFPYKWDLNIYRGCMHGCKYCFAIYSHSYLDDSDFFDTIFYKENIITLLEQELSSPTWKKEVINIGGVCDSYQPIEKHLKIMPEILKLMIRYKNPIIISTKSDLILRDIDLIRELSKVAAVNIACTITIIDESIRKELEPGAVSSLRRFEALRQIKETTNASVGVHSMPIIPYLTDYSRNLEELYYYASQINADYLLPGTIYLRGKTKPYFLDFLSKFDSNRYQNFVSVFYSEEAKKNYKANLYQELDYLKKKYQITSYYGKPLAEKIQQFKKEKEFIIMNYVTTMDSPLGILYLSESEGKITTISYTNIWAGQEYQQKETELLKEAKKQLQEYFEKKRKTFSLPLNPIGTDWQKKVWSALQDIPYGETCSYQDIAIAAGNKNASRAVGLANNKNPISIIIPCHRVIGKSGKLVGYGGGLDKKEVLLQLEQENQ